VVVRRNVDTTRIVDIEKIIFDIACHYVALILVGFEQISQPNTNVITKNRNGSLVD
jgi:hypothetical protein